MHALLLTATTWGRVDANLGTWTAAGTGTVQTVIYFFCPFYSAREGTQWLRRAQVFAVGAVGQSRNTTWASIGEAIFVLVLAFVALPEHDSIQLLSLSAPGFYSSSVCGAVLAESAPIR